MNNTPTNKYSEIVEQCKQALMILLLNADLIGTGEALSPEGKKRLQQIKNQTWRIDRELNKGGDKIEQEREEIKDFLLEIRKQNTVIGKHLASLINLIGSIRAGQLGISIMITDLEEKIR